MNRIPDNFGIVDLARNPHLLRKLIRESRQTRKVDVLTDKGVRRIQGSPRSLNSVLDLRGQSSAIPATRPPSEPAPDNGMELWLKADTLSLSDGAAVTTWLDSSGKGRHYTPTGGSNPTFKASALNGKPAVVSSGATQKMTNAVGLNFSAATIFCVFKRTNLVEHEELLIWGNAGGSNEAIGLSYHTTYGPMMSINTESGNYYKAGPAFLPVDGFHQFSHIWNGGALHEPGSYGIWRDGVAASLFAQSGFVSDPATGGTIFGDASTELCELIVYSRALSDEERQERENYLFAKYRIAGGGEEAAEYPDPEAVEEEDDDDDFDVDRILVSRSGEVLVSRSGKVLVRRKTT